jgi:AcrR family transcriptional regulator
MPAQDSPTLWLKAQDRADRKREAILQAAVRQFSRRGFGATSLDSIAQLLNVTKPAIYHYFSNKEEVLLESVRAGMVQLASSVEALDEAAAETGLARLRALLTRYGLIMSTDFGLCIQRVSEDELKPEAREEFLALKREIDKRIRALVEVGIEDGSIRAGNARVVAFTLAGGLNSISRWYDPEGPDSAEAVVETVIDTLLNGVAARRIPVAAAPSAAPVARVRGKPRTAHVGTGAVRAIAGKKSS